MSKNEELSSAAYDTSPHARITGRDLVISERDEGKLEHVEKRFMDWRIGEVISYCFGVGDKPTTKSRTGAELVERERIPGVSGFSINERYGFYFVDYTLLLSRK